MIEGRQPSQTGDDAAARALARHWRSSRRAIAWGTGVWALVSFAPLLFARELRFEVLGAPFAYWVAAQGAPLVYLLIVWRHERHMARLDARYRKDAVVDAQP